MIDNIITLPGKIRPEQIEGFPIDYSRQYFTTEALESGTISFNIHQWVGTEFIKSISYSTDNGKNWTRTENEDDREENLVITVNVNQGDKILWKGEIIATFNEDNYTASFFNSTARFNVYGNIMSLSYEDDFTDKKELNHSGQFSCLFYDNINNKKLECKIIEASNLILPATTLTQFCYCSMFRNCTSLTAAPALPATTLADYCYNHMFRGCTSLITTTELPATILAANCYSNMFRSCTSLTTAPALSATTLTNYCYQFMFCKCTSLTTAPVLPATILANYCYTRMFLDCTSLVTAPELPATALASGCYNYMFSGCSSLTTAPELPATTLANYCYQSMFWNCTALCKASELPATTLTEGCYRDMFNGCTSLTTAPVLPATTLASSCYQSMFNGCTSLRKAPELPATTLQSYCYLQMFWYCTSLNYIKCLATNISANECTSNWVGDVAASGTFVKAASMSSWTTGTNGIPANWNVYTEDEYKEIKKYELNSLINYPVTSVNGQTGAVTVDVPVTSVNGATGVVLLSKSDIGLGNVDNTSDANKPVSTATQTALNDKANNTLSNSYQTPAKVQELVSPVSGNTLEAAIQKLNNGIVDDEALWATVLNDLESRITTLQNNVSLPSGYSASSGTNNELIPESGDSLITAISKLHKAVLDLESMYSSLYNDLNTRLTALEA